MITGEKMKSYANSFNIIDRFCFVCLELEIGGGKFHL